MQRLVRERSWALIAFVVRLLVTGKFSIQHAFAMQLVGRRIFRYSSMPEKLLFEALKYQGFCCITLGSRLGENTLQIGVWSALAQKSTTFMAYG